MTENPEAKWERDFAEIVRAYPYPATPDIARVASLASSRASMRKPAAQVSVYRRGWALAAVIVILILGALLSVEPVRAAVIEMLQLGSVRIFFTEPTSTPIPTLTSTSTPVPALSDDPNTPTTTARPTETPTPSLTPTSLLSTLTGETTLAEAEAHLGAPIRLPTYPDNLGPPDHIFLDGLGETMVTSVWLQPEQPEQIRYMVYQLSRSDLAMKFNPQTAEETTVNGERAIWIEGPYFLLLTDEYGTNFSQQRIVDGRVLIWFEDEITYRLEGAESLEEVTRIAESFR